MKTLQHVASVASMSHAPFIAAAVPSSLALESLPGYRHIKDLKDHFEGPQFAKLAALPRKETTLMLA